MAYFFDLTPDELADLLNGWGMARYRGKQVMRWVYGSGVTDPAAMTNLSKTDRRTLSERLTFLRGQVVRRQLATDGTRKLLIEWPSPRSPAVPPGPNQGAGVLPLLSEAGAHGGGEGGGGTEGRAERRTECVMIPSPASASASEGAGPSPAGGASQRRTACVSSQIGCPVGCRFCASGLGGLAPEGNLSAGQIVEQVWRLGLAGGPAGEMNGDAVGGAQGEAGRITHVVFMGMGEPLSNFEAVTRAIRTLTADWGPGISARRITVSTVGLPAQIRRLAELDLPITLAISLHAPSDDIRRRIIPWASFVSMDQLIAAGRWYFEKTGREITLEYILLAGVNDQEHHARALARVARRLRSNVNLIRYNEVEQLPFGRPVAADVHRFQTVLRQAGVNAHIRASRGRDIAAACGQLRHETPQRAAG